MSREIKFRAWDSKRKKMYKLGYGHGRDRLMLLGEDNGWSFWDVLDGKDFDSSDEKECVANFMADKLMQYTGLHDKDGVEIYEGDIVVIPEKYPFFDDGKPNYVATVEWLFAGFQTVMHCVNPEKSGISDGMNSTLEDGLPLEVIGNIWENPELLK